MPTTDEVARYLRYALENLSDVNGHYEFEQLCRHLVRARVASNVVPATGPIGVLGDQGRDLETFRTYLSSELGREGGFLALVSQGTIVFACTTQKTDLIGKVRSDVAKIMGSGSKVDRIYALLSNDFPVGRRHEMSDLVRAEYEVDLEILDAQWIAQELSSSELFWIAERFLSIPAEFAPPQPEEEISGWYGDLLQTWRDRNPLMTLGDLLDIKDGLRHATFNDSRRQDLPFWLSLMRTFLEDEVDPELVRRSEYEISVATLRGMGVLTPVDELVDRYLRINSELERPVDLVNSAVLLMYAIGALQRGVTHIPPERLAKWNLELRTRTEQLLSSAPNQNSAALLLRTLGDLYLQPDPMRISNSDISITEPDGLLNRELSAPQHEDVYPFVSLDRGLETWTNLMKMVDEAPLFPIESFSDSFAVLSPFIYGHDRYRELAELTDDRLSVTAGRTAAASKCRDRAVALNGAGMTCAAIKEFHRAKIGWWSGDTMRGSLLSMMILSNCYRKLGMIHAAKQYALQTARTASLSNDDGLQDLFAAGIMHCVLLSYDLGEWASATSTAESALRLHATLVEPLNPDDERVTKVMYSLLWIYLSSSDVAPRLAERAKDLLIEAHMWEDIEDFVLEQVPQPPEHWQERIGEQIHGEWMSDLKQELRVELKVFGTHWTISGENDLATSCAIQRLAAALEIFLVDQFDVDFVLLEEKITIRVEVDAEFAEPVFAQSSSGTRCWDVTLTPWSEVGNVDVYEELVPIITTILGEISLLPAEQFFDQFGRSMKEGLVNKLSMGASMDLLLLWVRDESYDEIIYGTRLTPYIEDSRYIPQEHPELRWRDGLGPTYSQSAAEELIQLRYDRIPSQFSFTLNRLNSSEPFRKTVRILRRKGWLDWHILLAIANIVINQRAALRTKAKGEHSVAEIAMNYENVVHLTLSESETEDSPIVPESEFSIAKLESSRRMTLPIFLNNVGLELHQNPPDLGAIQKLLDARFRYWSDDVPHEDPFKRT